MDTPTERISKGRGWLMIGTALLFDVIGIIPVLNFVAAGANLMLFPFWFSRVGAPYTKHRKMMWVTIGTSLFGMIPFVSSILPELTLGVVKNVLYIQREDRKAIREASANQRMENEQNNNEVDAISYKLRPQQQNRPRVDSIRRAA